MVDASKSEAAAGWDDPAEASADARAAAAAEAIVSRHLRRFACLPGTRLAAIAWPSSMIPGALGRWHYWWQAHVVDLLVDAAKHRSPALADDTHRLLRGIALRNLGRWTNNYFDDMAWLGLALERADRHLGVARDKALQTLTSRLYDAWVPHLGGGIPWRTMDLFFNAPSNGPAAILLARTGHVERAVAMADWMDANLVDDTTGLIVDGVKPGLADSPRQVVHDIYTYCQGVVLGTELELLRLTGDAIHLERLDRLLQAVEKDLCEDGVIPGAGGGDGGLFAGILARYVALIATDLPSGSDGIRARAAAIVTTSADAAWTHRRDTEHGPVFGADWRHPARSPGDDGRKSQFSGGSVRSSQIPEQDLSVQLSGWMVLEAAAAVESRSPEHDETDAP
ncbi:fructose-bisphosphate aldolase [Gordonia sp. HNM0687]|uniref:Fructose-bisphosphate aldolase n=1 Tax=Gordonia mangrovi TaxID=2665643 RepID=A0A6L7GLN6_9ACTN|nr:glycoside hydrolase family 76 protein [Gordonia mangrovi]MXP20337.1 fructose-bisphosphate aldolase [Gordonia mangrovi]UVF79062.1 fructose-bisphosphate aldolase [Gordonia mangrovi]